MTKKRQAGSSTVSVMDEEELDLQSIDEASIDEDGEASEYINVEINTDNIEDIVTQKMETKINIEDIYMNGGEETETNFDIPKGVAVDDPVRLYLREIGRIKLLSANDEIALARQILEGGTAGAIAKRKLVQAN